MRFTRLTAAIDSGLFDLPGAGEIAVFRPHLGDDLSCLPRGQVRVLTGFRPDHDHFQALGYAVARHVTAAAAAILCLPRSKTAAFAMIAEAMATVAPGAPILVDGQKTDGVAAILKDCQSAGLVQGEALAKAHGKAFLLRAGVAPAGWAAAPQQIEGGFVTAPGVFSADAPDRGSVMLAAALPATLPSRIVDLGAGWGFLARSVLARPGVKELHLVEAEADALDCARQNIVDARAVFHWADATTFRPPHLAHAVVMNPPFHAGRDADPALGQGFLRAAARMLAPQGTLWMVANRHLPYDRVLAELFREVSEIGGDGAFKVVRAAVPVRQRGQ